MTPPRVDVVDAVDTADVEGPVRVDVLGIPVDVLVQDQLLDRVESMVRSAGAEPDRRYTVAYANVHVIHQAGHHPDLARFLRGVDLCYCDGKGVIWAARVLGRRLPERITGADWIWPLAARAEHRYRIFWLGGEPGVTDRAVAELRRRYPGLAITSDHGFHPREGPRHRELLARIAAWRPHILLVGMGTPLQERWVAANRAQLPVPVVWCLGATADFISGRVSRGPAFLYRNHEWLARLLADPRRMWRRYLVGNTRILGRAAFERIRRERFRGWRAGVRRRGPGP